MIQIIDRKTLENIREGVREGAGTAWKQARRVEWRSPWVYRKEGSSKPWVLGMVLFAAVLGVIGGILYFRKRKQVADRYMMGEPEASGTFASPSAKDSETLATVSPGIN